LAVAFARRPTVHRSRIIGILEIMKLMKPIAAGVAGTVSTVLVENGAPVEFGQALLLVEPEA
jgi:acetyl-CoA carboxylase biotin carboxyl carrier protein